MWDATTAGVEVRSSSRTSTPTRNPRPTPTHPHSTRKSRISEPSKSNGVANGSSSRVAGRPAATFSFNGSGSAPARTRRPPRFVPSFAMMMPPYGGYGGYSVASRASARTPAVNWSNFSRMWPFWSALPLTPSSSRLSSMSSSGTSRGLVRLIHGQR